jgi:hypothetical protein
LGNAGGDPYAVFRWVWAPGFNVPKVRPDSEIAQRKVFNAVALRPDALILGNSRAEIGIDPDHPEFRRRSLRAYNLAIPGGTLGTSISLLETMCSAGRYKLVLIGVDFSDFLIEPSEGAVAGGSEPRAQLLRLRPGPSDYLHAVLTSGAAADSIRTLQAQLQRYPEVITNAGFNPLLDYVPMAKDLGYYPLFQQRLQESARAYSRYPKAVVPSSGGDSPASIGLGRLVRRAMACGDRIVLITYPYHAHMLTRFVEVGLWPAFDDWKRLMVRTVQREAGDGASAARVRLFDFAYFSDVARQASPRPSQRDQTSPWYWEAGHFKKELGDQMLLQMLEEPEPARHRSPVAAVDLRHRSLDDWLEEVRAQLDRYRRERPDEVNAVRIAVMAAQRP